MNSLKGIPIVLILTCVIIGLCALSGFISGFVRKISGLVSFILACILVSIFLPTITSGLRTTPIYTAIRNRCEVIGNNIVKNVVVQSLGSDGAGDASSVVQSVTADDGSGRLDREKIKNALQERGYDPSVIDALSDAELESYAQQLIGATAGALSFPLLTVSYPCVLTGGSPVWTGYMVLLTDTASAVPSGTTQGTTGDPSVLSRLTSGMDRSEQIRFIEDLPLPEKLKEQMVTFNNSEGYQKLGATDFGSYVVNYIANLILNILAFLVALLVSWIIIRLLLTALSVFTALPIVGGVNRILGLLIGLVQGLLIVWVLFLILSLFASTPACKPFMDEISRTPILEALYNSNLLMNSTARVVRGIL